MLRRTGTIRSVTSGAGEQGERDDEHVPIWARQRGRRASTLTREAIVEAAMEIADAEGADAVSIRRVAAALGARTMSLYTYIDSKNDLFDLMADQVAGEVLITEELPAGWREAITVIARREREVSLRHPWIVDMAKHRAHAMVGPNLLRHVDQALAALAGLKLEPREALKVMEAVDDYMFGFTAREAREREITRRAGPGEADRWSAFQPYLRELIDSGEFTSIAPLLRGDVQAAESDFEQGLRWLLDGIEREYT
ncbi:TetR family transcriptional regulator [Actinoallomurus iriomotensis]|uniref:TetR family transcriptional regulator n=1 Tax=Actinoallomurus iriomotensis TaxID=478107 RepID=A0A9W6S1M7_9ACTN|nr:TetR family transcriptional regulator [Actinoallomurus iriomotensis]